jgi:hypothetical protein
VDEVLVRGVGEDARAPHENPRQDRILDRSIDQDVVVGPEVAEDVRKDPRLDPASHDVAPPVRVIGVQRLQVVVAEPPVLVATLPGLQALPLQQETAPDREDGRDERYDDGAPPAYGGPL